MTYLVLGTPDSGKSKIAEDLVMKLAENGPKYYVATMIPFGEEGEKRVKKHRTMREGKGFETIECPVRVHELLDSLPKDRSATGLLECMSNLIGNEMHDPSNADKDDGKLVQYITEEVLRLAGIFKDLIIVSNSFPLEDKGYDEDTKRYVMLVHMVNENLRKRVDEVYEIT